MSDVMESSGLVSRKRVPRLEKSLTILLKSLSGSNVVIELKNDTEISGVVDECDEGMNTVLVDVTIVTSKVCSTRYDFAICLIGLFFSGHSSNFEHYFY